ncbi:UDP-glucuronosyltransferase 2B20 [Liparis tanakae]|uniref:UDP-glucuronosyltransferase 2B20 n=1 Tax=Liparis tanakae TaxID=230148 RepID=A0A4Z2FDX1_9TELE|nr:UDP-glucuronosyltransferase 2B20 [Liparis tanakae]
MNSTPRRQGGCLAFWCLPCFACKTAHEAGECVCLPLLDSFGLIPPAATALRVSVRQRYGIEVQTPPGFDLSAHELLHLAIRGVAVTEQSDHRQSSAEEEAMDAALRKRRIEDFLDGLLTWEALVADKPPGPRPELRSPPFPVIPFPSIYHPGNPFATKPQQPGYRTAYHPGNPFSPKPQQPGNPSSYQTVYQPGNPFVYYKPNPQRSPLQPPCRRFQQFPLRPRNLGRSQFPRSLLGSCRSRLGSRRFQFPVFSRRFQSPVFRRQLQSPGFRRRLQSLRFRRRFQFPIFRFQSPVFRLHPARPRFSPFRLHPGRSQGPVLPRLPFQPRFPGTRPIRPTRCSGSRILVVPVDGSHWINMELILQELHARGHDLTVLRSAKSWYIPSSSSIYTSINVTMLEDVSDRSFYDKTIRDVVECRRSMPFISSVCQRRVMTSMLRMGHEMLARAAATMLDDPVFIKKLQDAKFDLMLTDPALTLGSSGEHGVVVMSLGTFVSAVHREATEAIAAAFAQLPQKVVWKFMGDKPSSLGNNTLLVKWMPQKDLLGHPKTRAFVAHGGTNGMFEAIYHGVPVLGLPLLFDQFDNLVRLKVRGAARVVEAKSITTEGFLEALKDVLETPSYRDNIQRLSQLHRDRPMSPMDTAVFWIEYVIRNKGAAHLQSAGFHLPWYSYFCLDVAVLFVALIAVSVWASVSVCKMFCCRRSRRKTKAE